VLQIPQDLIHRLSMHIRDVVFQNVLILDESRPFGLRREPANNTATYKGVLDWNKVRMYSKESLVLMKAVGISCRQTCLPGIARYKDSHVILMKLTKFVKRRVVALIRRGLILNTIVHCVFIKSIAKRHCNCSLTIVDTKLLFAGLSIVPWRVTLVPTSCLDFSRVHTSSCYAHQFGIEERNISCATIKSDNYHGSSTYS